MCLTIIILERNKAFLDSKIRITGVTRMTRVTTYNWGDYNVG